MVWFGWFGLVGLVGLVWFGLAWVTSLQILRVDYLSHNLVPIGNFNHPTADVINLSFGPFNGSEQESLEDSR